MNDIQIAEKYLAKKNNADQRKIEFSLSFTAFKNLMRAKKCAYTGIALTEPIIGKAPRVTDRTIDRKDNKKGYIPGNTVCVCNGANQLKSKFEDPFNPLTINHVDKMVRKLLRGTK